MIYVEKSKRYYHASKCIEAYNKTQEETAKENEQWDLLNKYIVALHDLVLLPKVNIFRLKDLRAGFEVKNGKRVRKYRTGPDYELMLDAYKLADKSIKWNITNTLKGNNDVGAINYCMSIMMGSLNEAYVRRKRREKNEVQRIIDQGSNQQYHYTDLKTIEYTKKETSNDISSFLD